MLNLRNKWVGIAVAMLFAILMTAIIGLSGCATGKKNYMVGYMSITEGKWLTVGHFKLENLQTLPQKYWIDSLIRDSLDKGWVNTIAITEFRNRKAYDRFFEAPK